MECITACPDTALPNTCQDVATVLKTAANYYVTDPAERHKLMAELKGVEDRARVKMNESVKAKTLLPFQAIIRGEVTALTTVGEKAKAEFTSIIDTAPPGLFPAMCWPFSVRSNKSRRAAAGCSRFLFPTCAKAAANASRFAAIMTPCA